MMSSSTEHNDLADLLRQSLDRRLSATEQERLDDGLKKNAALREELAELQQLRNALRTLHPPANPAFAARVLQRLPKEEQLLRSLVVQWRSVAAAACLALLLAAGFIYASNGNLETETILGLEQMELDDVYAFDE